MDVRIILIIMAGISLACSIAGIILLITYYKLSRPDLALTDDEQRKIKRYGLILFVSRKQLYPALKNGFAVHKYFGRYQKYSWYYLSDMYSCENAEKIWNKIKRWNRRSNICLVIRRIPKEVLDNLYKNREGDIAFKHQFSKDGKPCPIKADITVMEVF